MPIAFRDPPCLGAEMKSAVSFATICLLFAAHPASAEEEHGAIKAFKLVVAAAKAKDGGKIRHFIASHHWPALAKSGKKDELIGKMIAAAEKDGATFSYRDTEGPSHQLNGEILIEPDGVRVPVAKAGDPWGLDVKKLVGEVKVTSEEKQAYDLMAGYVSNLGSYKESIGSYPTTAQGLQALAVKPTTDPVPRRWFRLIPAIAKDPWGNDFVYEASKDGIKLRSLGPDGKESDDDIVSPF
ncbi:MAG: hypothetical protein HKN82_11290 [Akkermansiaceae bacterium]|nr:hypothetical protein [Akkermansiaceae bacterium]